MAADEPPGEAAPREPTRRLFFALWPDEAMREALAQATRKAARACGGRPIPAANMHLTLAFLGSVPERRLAELAAIGRIAALQPAPASAGALDGPSAPCGGAASPGKGLELVLDRLEYWRAAQLLCAVPAEPPASMAALARRLQDPLAAQGFAPDLKSSRSAGVNFTRPFRPHVTLVRKAPRSPRVLDIDPVAWSFADFALVDSKTLPEGSVYTVLERFSLGH